MKQKSNRDRDSEWPRLILLAAALGYGCAPEEPPDEPDGRVLAPLASLSEVDAATDPLAAHRPDEISCNGLSGWYLENGDLEVNTADCNYLSLVEPAALSAQAGEIVQTEISHFDLTAPEPAEAHLAFLIGGALVWELTIPIPAPAQVRKVDFELPSGVEPGDPIVIHLHNHGQNTWNFSPLLVAP